MPPNTPQSLSDSPSQLSTTLLLASASPRRKELIGLLGLPFEVIPSRYDEPPAPSYALDLPAFVTELATNKGLEVAQRMRSRLAEGALVVAADTLVTLSDDVRGVPLGKPTDAEDAFNMLRQLSGRTHRVYTGITLLYDPTAYSWQPANSTNETEQVTTPPNNGTQPSIISFRTRADVSDADGTQPSIIPCTAEKGTADSIDIAILTAVPYTRVTFRPMTDTMIRRYIATGEPMDKAGAYGAQGHAAPYIERIEGDYFNVVGLSLCLLARMLESMKLF